MKILFFPYFPNNPYQPNLMKALGEKGYQVAGVKNESLLTLIRSFGYQIYHLHWTHPYLVSDRFWKTLIKISLFFPFLLIVKLRGQKIVWTVHNLGEHERKQWRLELLLHRILARICDSIIVHSRYAAQKVIEHYWLQNRPNKVHVVPHGNYLDNYPNEISRRQARQALGLDDEQKVFLYFGQIRPYKGVPELIKAFSKVSTSSEVLLIAGFPFDQKTHHEVFESAQNNQQIQYYSEFIPPERIQEFMNAADVVVFPFKSIFTSGSVLLAMSFARAIIIPELQSMAEIIEIGGCITFSPEDSEELEKAINKALRADLLELGELNLKAAEKLSWSSIAEKTAVVYN